MFSDEFEPLSNAANSAMETMAIACEISSACESPIEIDLGAQLLKAIRLIPDTRLSLKIQHWLGPYRYDFAIMRRGSAKPIVVIECDGKEFHQTAEQLRNDRAKDALAKKEGVFIFRFSGSEIFRDPKACALRILR